MPYPNEHAARQEAPGKFSEFRRSTQGYPAGVSVVYGISNGKSTIQSVRFDSSKWTTDRARAWLKDHKMRTGIEAATGKVLEMAPEEFTEFTIHKVEPEKRVVWGWAYVSVDKNDNTVVDHSGEMTSIYTIEDAAIGYALKSRAMGVMHRRENGTVKRMGSMVFSMVFTKELQKVLGIPDGILPQGWLCAYYVEDDETWEAVKSGKLACLSIGGRAHHQRIAA